MPRVIQKIQRIFFRTSRQTKVLTFGIGAIAVVSFLLWVPPVFAQDGASIAQSILNKASEVSLVFARIFMALTIFSLKFFIELAAYNDFINAPTVKVGWVMIRDVANMFFVVVLLVIAFGTILGLEQYEWKKTLGKFVMAAILINFSKLIAGIIIDVAHVFTITFVNAIAATAGGNIINMFQMGAMMSMTGQDVTSSLGLEIFAAAVLSVVFAGMAFMAIGAYTVVMLFRMVALWVLIILSPLAYIFSVIPKTQSIAQEWWTEFMKYVISAPIMVFFLWLAFATLGSGNIISDLKGINMTAGEEEVTAFIGATKQFNGSAVSISQVSSWQNMANLMIAIAFLVIGLQRVNKLGVAGGGMVSGAIDFGKKVAAVATGYNMGRWVYEKGAGGVKRATGAVLKAPFKATGAVAGFGAYHLAGKHIAMWGKRQYEGFGSWKDSDGYRPVLKRKKDKDGKDTDEYETDSKGRYIPEQNEDGTFKMEKHDLKFGWLQKVFHAGAERTARSEKMLEKTKKFSEVNKELMKKRVSGVPTYLLQHDEEKIDALDRMKQGELEAEKARSDAKTKHYAGLGKLSVLMSPRIQEGMQMGPTMMDQITSHDFVAKTVEEKEKEIKETSRTKVWNAGREEAENVSGKIEEITERYMDPEERKALKAVDDDKAKSRAIDQEAKKKVEQQSAGITKKFDKEITTLSTNLANAELAWNNILEGVGLGDKEMEERKIGIGVIQITEDKIEELKEKLSAKNKEPKTEARKAEIREIEEEKNREESNLSKFRKEIPGLNDAETKVKKEKEAKEAKIKDKEKEFTTVAIRIGNESAEKRKNQRIDVAGKETALKTVRDRLASVRAEETTPAAIALREQDELRDEEIREVERQSFELDTTATQEQKDAALSLRLVAARQAATTAKGLAEESEAETTKNALGLASVRALFDEEQSAKIGEDAAKKFVESIKQQKISDIFKKGAEKLEHALTEGLKTGSVNLERLSRNQLGGDRGALYAQAEVLGEYTKDITTVSKQGLMDAADDIYSLDRYGFKNPSTAFNAWVKKRGEAFVGVEREQSVVMAMGSLGKLLAMKESGQTLTKDQEAQMMANIKHLTTQAWSDDLLGRIVHQIEDGQNGKLFGEAREQAEMLHDVFVNKLKWGSKKKEVVSGETKVEMLTMKNRSGNDRTNDLHNISRLGGDTDLWQSEKLNLKFADATGRSFVDSSKGLTEKLATQTFSHNGSNKNAVQLAKEYRDAQARGGDTTGIVTALEGIADAIGIVGKAGDTRANEIVAFTGRFLDPSNGGVAPATKKAIEESSERFLDSIKNFAQASELMADFKNLALKVGHLDDGGHTIYDMDAGFARGQLAKEALKFVVSDWRKMGLDQRLRILKSHGVMQMDEKSGTAIVPPEMMSAFRETFAGLQNEHSWKQLDGRVVDHLGLLAAGEDAIKGKDGRRILGDKRSIHVSMDADGDVEEAMKQMARSTAVALVGNALAPVISLAQRAGGTVQDGFAGVNLNMRVVDQNGKEEMLISKVEDLLLWVKRHTDDDFLKSIGFSEREILSTFEKNRKRLPHLRNGVSDDPGDVDIAA